MARKDEKAKEKILMKLAEFRRQIASIEALGTDMDTKPGATREFEWRLKLVFSYGPDSLYLSDVKSEFVGPDDSA
jgi:hypothetical protein